MIISECDKRNSKFQTDSTFDLASLNYLHLVLLHATRCDRKRKIFYSIRELWDSHFATCPSSKWNGWNKHNLHKQHKCKNKHLRVCSHIRLRLKNCEPNYTCLENTPERLFTIQHRTLNQLHDQFPQLYGGCFAPDLHCERKLYSAGWLMGRSGVFRHCVCIDGSSGFRFPNVPNLRLSGNSDSKQNDICSVHSGFRNHLAMVWFFPFFCCDESVYDYVLWG